MFELDLLALDLDNDLIDKMNYVEHYDVDRFMKNTSEYDTFDLNQSYMAAVNGLTHCDELRRDLDMAFVKLWHESFTFDLEGFMDYIDELYEDAKAFVKEREQDAWKPL